MQAKCISTESLQDILKAANFEKEQQGVERAIFSDWFDMPLQQAAAFCNEKKNILIVGDAAASASYLRGSGANTGFQTAHFAGMFLKKAASDKHGAYLEYNERVKKATDALIESSFSLY
jgi:2-polyprenyl-6-methoxyphenol hydroxylase-like FAD-dependent oxidoreductase